MEISLRHDLFTDELEKRHLLGLGADVDRLNETILKFDVLTSESDHGHQAFAQNGLEALL